jgi:hypothetical protein
MDNSAEARRAGEKIWPPSHVPSGSWKIRRDNALMRIFTKENAVSTMNPTKSQIWETPPNYK